MLKIKDLRLELPDFVLTDVNLEIADRDFFAILGPTGSGKTLLLETIIGLREPDSGQIICNDIDITSYSPEKRKIGIVYQDYALFPHMTVKENIYYGVKYLSQNQQNLGSKFENLIDSLSIAHLLNRYPKNLSGGEKQRVALARVLILGTNIILLDEPLSSLDNSSKKEICQFLKHLHKSFEITLIMVSHDFSDILYLANNGVLMNNGKIIQAGSIEDIFYRPNSRFTAKFVRTKNIFPVKIENNKILISEKIKIALASGIKINKPSFASIRPEEIELVNCKNLTENTFDGEITEISPEGFFFAIKINIHNVTFNTIATRKTIVRNDFDVGSLVKISIPTNSVHLF